MPLDNNDKGVRPDTAEEILVLIVTVSKVYFTMVGESEAVGNWINENDSLYWWDELEYSENAYFR